MSARTFPFRTATDHVTAEPWITDNGAALDDFLPAWDYSSVLRCSRRLRIDLPAILQQCGLGPDALLAVNVRYWPTTSWLRSNALHLPLGTVDARDEVERLIEVEIPGRGLAGAVVLETTVVLAESISAGVPFVARRKGSILWQDEHTLRLEGSAGLLPVAPVSFKDQGLPERAAWYVSVDSAEWGSAAMGNLLVLLNNDNDRVRTALAAPEDPDTALLWDALTVDVVCDLVGRAVEDEEFTTWPADTPGSADRDLTTAGLVHAMVRGFLRMPGETLEDAMERLREEHRRDPSRMRAAAQSSLRFPGR